MFYLCEKNINRERILLFSVFSKLLLNPLMTTSLNFPSSPSSDESMCQRCPMCGEKDCLPPIPMSSEEYADSGLKSPLLSPLAEDKEFSGLQRSEEMTGQSQIRSPMGSVGLKDNSNAGSPVTSIGNLSLRSELRAASLRFKRNLGLKDTTNLPVQKKLKLTAGKMTLQSEADLKLEQNPFVETRNLIGRVSGKLQNGARSSKSPQTFEWLITGPYAQLVHTTLQLNQFAKPFTTSGGQLTLENRTERGQKPGWMLTAKTRDPSGGMVTKVNEMLLWMNFEEELISHISSGGSTGILLLWKSKVPLLPSSVPISGSQVICPLLDFTTTTQKWVKPAWMLFCDE